MNEIVKKDFFVKKSKRSRIAAWFGVFLMFMLICSIVSRGIYAMQIPRVVTGYATVKSIEHKIEGDGMIAEGSEHPVNIREGILVSEVCVKEGEKIDEGTLLLRLDLDSLKEKYEEAGQRVEEERTRLNDLQSNKSATQDAANKEKNRAQTDLLRITGEQNDLVASAQGKFDAAAAEEANYPDFDTYFEEKKSSDAEYKSMKESGGKELKAYENKLRESAKEEWENKKNELRAAKEEAEAALLEAKKNSDSAIENARRNAEDAGKISQDNAGILAQQNVVADCEEEAAELKALLDANGEIVSKIAGSIAKVNIYAGDTTVDGAAFLVAGGEEGWTFSARIMQDQKKYVSSGDAMEVNFADLGIRLYDVEIVSVQKDEEGMYEIRAKLEEPGLSLGDTGTFSIVKSGEEYPCCVPLSALYAGDSTTYVLIVQEENTILGTELRAVKREVTVVDKNDTYAALDGAPLTKDEPIITSSDRAVAADARVRPEEP